MTKQLQINVRVVTCTTKTLQVIPEEPQTDCPRCQAGQGCGNQPWFRGLFRQHNTLTIAQLNPPLNIGDKAQLSITTNTITLLSFLTYAAPLSAFMVMLWLLQGYHEGVQLLMAIISMGLIFIVSRYYINKLLFKEIRVNKHSNIYFSPQKIN